MTNIYSTCHPRARVIRHAERLDWAAPVWTGKLIGLVVVAGLLGMLAALLGSAYTRTIEVRSEWLNHLYIVLWQFLANGNLVWFMAIGTAMSVSLGKEEAKAAVLRFGAERATLHLFGTGTIIGLFLGVAYFLALTIRLPFVAYLAFSTIVTLLASRWHYSAYGIEGQAWIATGLAATILLRIFTQSMIEHDHRQRRLVTEQSP